MLVAFSACALPGLRLCIKACKLAIVEFAVAVFVESLQQSDHFVRWKSERFFAKNCRRLVQCQKSIAVHVELRERSLQQLFAIRNIQS